MNMALVQVPESLADDLCRQNGCRLVLPTRSGVMEAALVVLAAGSNVVSLVVAPEGIKGSLETIRSWLRRRSPEIRVEVHGPSIDGRIVIRDQADVDAAVAAMQAALHSTHAQ